MSIFRPHSQQYLPNNWEQLGLSFVENKQAGNTHYVTDVLPIRLVLYIIIYAI
jgi:hypothetical protein